MKKLNLDFVLGTNNFVTLHSVSGLNRKSIEINTVFSSETDSIVQVVVKAVKLPQRHKVFDNIKEAVDFYNSL